MLTGTLLWGAACRALGVRDILLMPLLVGDKWLSLAQPWQGFATCLAHGRS